MKVLVRPSRVVTNAPFKSPGVIIGHQRFAEVVCWVRLGVSRVLDVCVGREVGEYDSFSLFKRDPHACFRFPIDFVKISEAKIA